MRNFYFYGTTLILASGLVACGGDTAAPVEDAPQSSSEPAAATSPAAVSAGQIAFSVDGEAKTFDYAPADENKYVKLASTVVAQPAAGAAERLAITFLSLDLKSFDFPMDLPAPRDPSNPNPMAAMANVGFSYTAPDGSEWAGPGKIHVESLDSEGILSGTFTDVTLPDTDKQKPNAVLTAGSFRIKLGSIFWPHSPGTANLLTVSFSRSREKLAEAG